MVTLEVGLDATKVVGGARDAFSALIGLSSAATQALTGMERIGGATGAFATFGATVNRVIPFIAAGSAVIAAISSTMSLFARATSDATEGYKKLGDTLRTTAAEADIAKLFGDESLAQNGRQRNIKGLFDRAVEIKQGGGSPISIRDFSGSLGPDVGPDDIADALAKNPDFIRQSEAIREKRVSGDFLVQRYLGTNNSSVAEDIIKKAIYDEYQISPEDQIGLLRGAALNYGVGRMVPVEARIRDNVYPGQAQLTDNFSLRYSIGEPFNGVRISQDDQSKVNIENMQRAMADIERSSQRVGQYLGDAATALVTGAAGWRDIAQQVIQDLIRAGLTQGFTSLSKSFLSGFGATPAQTTAPT